MLPWTLRRWLGLPHPDEADVPVDPADFVRPPNVAFDQPMAWAVRHAPDDDVPLRAYAAWLTENNDPRGALIVAMLEGADGRALLDEHPAVFEGPVLTEKCLHSTWARGFWRTLTVRDPWGDAAEQVLAEALSHPSALILHGLSLHTGRMEPLADVLADGDVLPLRELVVDAEGTLLGTWSQVWPRVPELRTLQLLGNQPSLGAMSLEHLTRLELRGLLGASVIDDLKRAHLPALEVLLVPEPDLLRDVFGTRVRA